jgi:hypothetical protein
MKPNSLARYRITKLIVVALILSISGCLPLPYYVSPDVTINEQDELLDDGITLTIAPRELLEKISKVITDSHENIEIVDGLVFRDTAFPEGGWKLSQLLDPVTRKRISTQLDVRYLVIVGRNELLRSGGEYKMILPGVLGAASAEKVSTISAAIIDIMTGETECQVSSVARGTERAAHWVIIVAGTIPLTSASAIKALAREIGRKINNLAGPEKTRIAILATENKLQ